MLRNKENLEYFLINLKIVCFFSFPLENPQREMSFKQFEKVKADTQKYNYFGAIKSTTNTYFRL